MEHAYTSLVKNALLGRTLAIYGISVVTQLPLWGCSVWLPASHLQAKICEIDSFSKS